MPSGQLPALSRSPRSGTRSNWKEHRFGSKCVPDGTLSCGSVSDAWASQPPRMQLASGREFDYSTSLRITTRGNHEPPSDNYYKTRSSIRFAKEHVPVSIYLVNGIKLQGRLSRSTSMSCCSRTPSPRWCTSTPYPLSFRTRGEHLLRAFLRHLMRMRDCPRNSPRV